MSDDVFAAFDAAVAAALEAAGQNSPELVHKIDEVDAAFRQVEEKVGEPAVRKRIWETVLPKLRESPRLVSSINFASSLTASGTQSVFFHTARMLCAQHVNEMPPEWLTGIVESYRRARKYDEMQEYADLIHRKIGGDLSAQSCKTLSKLDYELAMASVQQARAAYELAEVIVRRSAAYAEQAGDAIGRLFALMVEGEQVLPHLGKWREGYDLCVRVCLDAGSLANRTEKEPDRRRLERIVMNMLYCQLKMAVDHGGEAGTVQGLLDALEANPIRQMSKGEPWAEEPLAKARAYIQEKMSR